MEILFSFYREFKVHFFPHNPCDITASWVTSIRRTSFPPWQEQRRQSPVGPSCVHSPVARWTKTTRATFYNSMLHATVLPYFGSPHLPSTCHHGSTIEPEPWVWVLSCECQLFPYSVPSNEQTQKKYTGSKAERGSNISSPSTGHLLKSL